MCFTKCFKIVYFVAYLGYGIVHLVKFFILCQFILLGVSVSIKVLLQQYLSSLRNK